MITAHSGCDRTEDNSLAFITYALTLPVDAFEIDIRKNSRGELILSHDETQEEAVRLSEAFQLLKEHPEKKINCDLKQLHLEADVFSLAQQYGVENQLIFTGDVEPALFQKGAVAYPQVTWFTNLETLAPDFESWQKTASEPEIVERLEQVLLQMKAYETAGINWHFRLAEKIWEKAVSLGIGISVWTVNDPAEQKRWLDRQAANVTSREISKLIALRDAQTSKEVPLTSPYVYYRLESLENLVYFPSDAIRTFFWDDENDLPIIQRFYAHFDVPDITRSEEEKKTCGDVIALVQDGEIVSMTIPFSFKPGELEIGAVSTLPEHQNKGYCRRVISEAARQILEQGLAATLTTKRENTAMRKTAEAIGMHCVNP